MNRAKAMTKAKMRDNPKEAEKKTTDPKMNSLCDVPYAPPQPLRPTLLHDAHCRSPRGPRQSLSTKARARPPGRPIWLGAACAGASRRHHHTRGGRERGGPLP